MAVTPRWSIDGRLWLFDAAETCHAVDVGQGDVSAVAFDAKNVRRRPSDPRDAYNLETFHRSTGKDVGPGREAIIATLWYPYTVFPPSQLIRP
jgi:hypothetical protein